MPVRLLIGPVGSGKTSRALDIFKQFAPSEHQHAVRFIVPTVSHVLGIRSMLLSDSQFPGLLGDPICTFHRLMGDILMSAESGRPKLISDMQRLLAVGEAVASTPASCFEAVRGCPNFPDALGRTIGSLKAAGVTPEDLERAVESSDRGFPESSSERILGLAAYYRAYEGILAGKGVYDREGATRQALESARRDLQLLQAFECVILDGFAGFTPIQQDIIRLMAERSDEMVIALDYEEGRPEVFSSVEPSMEFLVGLPGMSVERVPRPQKGAALGHLEAHLFQAAPSRLEPDDGVTVLVGATPAMEVELVAEEIETLLRKGCQPADIGIIARNIEPYRHRIASAFRQFRIPLAPQSRPLSENALARHVLRCLPEVRQEAAETSGADRLIRAIEALVSGFEWPASGGLQDDCAAWKSIQRIMADIAASEELLGREIGPDRFAELLETGVRTGTYRVPGSDADGVVLLDVNTLAGRKFRAVFVVGLLERVFPRQPREDPFLRDWEREKLSRYLPRPLDLRLPGLAREACLFYTAVSSAREHLYLSWHRADVSGRENSPSPYLDEVDSLFARRIPCITRDLRDVVPPMDRVETAKSLAARVVLDCCTSTDEEAQDAAAAAYNLLLEAGQIGPEVFELLAEDED